MRPKLLSLLALGAAGFLAASAMSRLRTRRFDDRVVLITGGSRGLGLALACEFGRRGARLALMARDENELQQARAQLASITQDVVIISGDVRDPDDAKRAVEVTLERFGQLDVLLNDAGTIAVGPMETMRREDYQESVDTHFWGTYNMVEAAWHTFRRRGAGAIVNISSIGGRISVPHLLPYSVGKFAQVGYSEGLRAEAARFGIRVTTVTPGLMRTGSPVNAWFKGDNKAEYGWFATADAIPLLSVSASYAARRIADAVASGEANVSIGPSAFLATCVHGFSPGLTARALRIANDLLPKAREEEHVSYQGRGSENGITDSPLTALNRRAEQQYNQ